MPLHAGAAIDALRRVEESLAAEDREGQIRCGADGGLREQGDPVQILEGSTLCWRTTPIGEVDRWGSALPFELEIVAAGGRGGQPVGAVDVLRRPTGEAIDAPEVAF
jgi:hypothetical protein